MNHTMYQQTCRTMDLCSYEALKKTMPQLMESSLRKISFLPENCSRTKSGMSYQITMESRNENLIYLEQKQTIHHNIRKNYVRITRAQCEQIFAGDTLWMFLSDNTLLQSFYFQMQIDRLKPVLLSDIRREVCYDIHTGISRVFETSIGQVAFQPELFFAELLNLPETLRPNTVRYIEKKEQIVPIAVYDMLHHDPGTLPAAGGAY